MGIVNMQINENNFNGQLITVEVLVYGILELQKNKQNKECF